MARPQRDDLINEIVKTDALLEYAVMHGEEQEAERLRVKLRRLASMGDGAVPERRMPRLQACVERAELVPGAQKMAIGVRTGA